MGKETLYSRSRRSRSAGKEAEAVEPPEAAAPREPMQRRADAAPRVDTSAAAPAGAAVPPGTTAAAPARRSRWRRLADRRSQILWFLSGVVLAAALATALNQHLLSGQRKLTQADIDRAVVHTLAKTTLPSPAAKAADIIRPSVVRIHALGKAEKPVAKPSPQDKDKNGPPKAPERGTSTGSGVVAVESGLILTSLHVVAGADEIEVTFADGTESPAMLVSAQPENDLAVLQATTLPDDLVPATLRSTGDLRPGDMVVATGFPFGIGPSVTSGVISGLRREYHSPEGKTLLTNLIQFDAAANPGSSGGPLVTAEGEVVGIVTAILNPSDQRVFIGIGFAVPIENAASGLGLPPF